MKVMEMMAEIYEEMEMSKAFFGKLLEKGSLISIIGFLGWTIYELKSSINEIRNEIKHISTERDKKETQDDDNFDELRNELEALEDKVDEIANNIYKGDK